MVICALAAGAHAVRAQDIEPRAYANAPVGVNFLVAGYAFTDGGAAFDPSLPLTDPQLETHNAVLAWVRVLDVGGLSSKIEVVVPYTWLSGSAEFSGDTVERSVRGFADPRLRLSVNFHGAPALKLPDYRAYRQDLIVGGSLQVGVPLGQYDDGRLVNIGSHRWWFKPELGVSKALGRWTLEGSLAATLFTDNEDFFGGMTRSQDPVWSSQAHIIHGWSSGVWASFDATYFTGGETTLDDDRKDDLQSNWRLGATLTIPAGTRHSLKLYASRGVSSRTGNDFDLLGFAWQYRWGGGL